MTDPHRGPGRVQTDSCQEDRLADAIGSAQHGDDDGFRVLYGHLQPRLLRLLRNLVGTNDAPDVAAETWLKITTDIRGFRGSVAGFRAWATTIARHRAVDHLRRERATPLPPEQLPDKATDDDPEQEAIDSAATEAALKLIADLPRDQAQAVLLHVVLGLNAPNTARILHKKPGAVRTSTHRGIRNLQRRLTQ